MIFWLSRLEEIVFHLTFFFFLSPHGKFLELSFNAILLFAFNCGELKCASERAGAIPFPNLCSNSVYGHARLLRALSILVLKMPKATASLGILCHCLTVLAWLLASLNFSLFNLWQWSIILPLCSTENSLAFIFCVLKSKTYYYLMWALVYHSAINVILLLLGDTSKW